VPRLLFRFLSIFAFAAATLSCLAADRVLFTRLGPTQATLFISNADGSAERPLTQPGSLNYNPAWSPRGDWIVFTSEREGPANLFRMRPDGSDVERLTTDAAYDDQAAFSPDGRQIAFVSTRATGFANLWVLDLATRKARALTTGRGGDFRPAWSPDGRWIAFSSDRDSSLPTAKSRWERLQLVDIYLIHPDGSGLRRISQHGNFCGSPRWTADSKSVVTYCMSAEDTWTYRTKLLTPYEVGGANQLYRIDIATGSIVPITSGPGVKLAPSVLASGRIAYLRGDGARIEIVSADGKVGPSGTDIAPNPAAWSPDDNHVVYSRTGFTPSSAPVKQWSRNPNFDLYATTALPAYDRTGMRLAVSNVVPGGVTSLMVIDGNQPARAILERKDLILGPQWSPDSKQIVVGVGGFTSFLDFAAGTKKPIDRVNGGAQVAILNADGTGFHLVTSGPNNNGFAAFSPDGKRIVYRTAGPDGEGLRIMNLADRSVTVLTDQYDNFPLWSPRGDLIAFVRNIAGDFEVMTVHPDGKAITQLTRTHGNEAHLAWSPDGERLLFTSSRMGFKDETLYTGSPQPYGEIFVMNSDGTHVEQLTDDQWEEGGPAWQPHHPALTSAQVARK
jgi:Tol biopolymer transport system component